MFIKKYKNFRLKQKKSKEFDINFFENKIYSQNGEDGIIEFIFSKIKSTNKFFVEIGAVGIEGGTQCNTKNLLEKDWLGVILDSQDCNLDYIKKEFVTAENINTLFSKYDVPQHFDLLSIDIDFNDYWVWKSLKDYCPRVVVIEYNATIPPNKSLTVEYDRNGKWDKTNYFGASLLALAKLGNQKGYQLVGCDSNGVNAFFVLTSELKKLNLVQKTVSEYYKPPKYGRYENGVYLGHLPSNKKMMSV